MGSKRFDWQGVAVEDLMVEKLFWGRSEFDWQGSAVEDVMVEKLFGAEANLIGKVLRWTM